MHVPFHYSNRSNSTIVNTGWGHHNYPSQAATYPRWPRTSSLPRAGAAFSHHVCLALRREMSHAGGQQRKATLALYDGSCFTKHRVDVDWWVIQMRWITYCMKTTYFYSPLVSSWLFGSCWIRMCLKKNKPQIDRVPWTFWAKYCMQPDGFLATRSVSQGQIREWWENGLTVSVICSGFSRWWEVILWRCFLLSQPACAHWFSLLFFGVRSSEQNRRWAV